MPKITKKDILITECRCGNDLKLKTEKPYNNKNVGLFDATEFYYECDKCGFMFSSIVKDDKLVMIKKK
jgi:hypothetical protein